MSPVCAQEKELSEKEQEIYAAFAETEEREYLENNYAGDLRGFFWGLSPTVILEHEPAYFLGEENGSLFYQDYYDDIKVTIGYEFVDNKLWRAKTFNEKFYYTLCFN